ncbi:MAG: hypothetical protein U5M23_02975 [Marinagarivorans sp.]|nr:hypothetical protein [Marinagarivorans sp.]
MVDEFLLPSAVNAHQHQNALPVFIQTILKVNPAVVPIAACRCCVTSAATHRQNRLYFAEVQPWDAPSICWSPFTEYGGARRTRRPVALQPFSPCRCLTGLVHVQALLDDTMIEHAWRSRSPACAAPAMTVLDHPADGHLVEAGMSAPSTSSLSRAAAAIARSLGVQPRLGLSRLSGIGVSAASSSEHAEWVG